jgi:hypothetical protein
MFSSSLDHNQILIYEVEPYHTEKNRPNHIVLQNRNRCLMSSLHDENGSFGLSDHFFRNGPQEHFCNITLAMGSNDD